MGRLDFLMHRNKSPKIMFSRFGLLLKLTIFVTECFLYSISFLDFFEIKDFCCVKLNDVQFKPRFKNIYKCHSVRWFHSAQAAHHEVSKSNQDLKNVSYENDLKEKLITGISWENNQKGSFLTLITGLVRTELRDLKRTYCKEFDDFQFGCH